MQTTCPECRTTFRVSQEHLGLRRGLVRCGHCKAVFNAYDTLLADLEEPPRPGHARPAPPAAPQPPHPGPPHAEPVYVEPETLDLAPPPTDPAPAPQPRPPVKAPPAPDSSESILLTELPTRAHARKPRPPRWQSALLGLAALLLLVTLALQVAYFFRAELAAAAPDARPLLTRLCRPLGCAVPLPRQLTRQAIVASTLEHDPEQKSRVRLTCLLANRTGQTQAWPHLALTLSDVRAAPVAHKLFPPASYLPKGIDARAGMAADTEQEVRLDLDVGSLAASGYALRLAYP